MIRDYQLVSPSLDGVLNDATLSYEGIKKPVELLRILDGPASRNVDLKERRNGSESLENEKEKKDADRKLLEEYFHDLYGVFMKKLSFFIVQSDSSAEDNVKLQAMLQEMIKIKRLLGY